MASSCCTWVEAPISVAKGIAALVLEVAVAAATAVVTPIWLLVEAPVAPIV